MKKPSWRFKLIFLFVGVLTISLLIQIFYVTPYIRNREIENTKIYQEEVANNIARELDVGLNRIKNELLRMSKLPEFRKMNIEAMQRIILDLEFISERISTIAVMNSEGFFVCSPISEKKIPEYTTQSYEDEPYFAIPFDEGKIYLSPPRYYTEENLVFTDICIPVESESGKRVGVLIGSMDLKDIIKRVFAYPLEKGQEASITTKEGTIIAHSDVDLFTLKDNPLSLKSDCTLKQEIFESGKDGSIKHKHKGIDYYGSYIFLESNGWLVAVESSMKSVLTQSSKMFQRILLIELLFFAIALIITIFFAGQITKAQRKAEKALRKSEEKYRLLTETASDFIILHDMNGQILYANRAAVERTGYSYEDCIKMSVQDIIPKDKIGQLLENKEERRKKDLSRLIFETEIITKSGKRIPLEVSSSPFIRDGEVTALLIIARDITERKQAEDEIKEKSIELEKQFEKSEKQRIATLSVLADLNKTTVNLKAEITERKQAEKELTKLSTAVTQSPSVIAITDKKGNLEYVNPKFTELTGYTFEEAKGENPRILKSGEQPDEMYKELWETISSGKEWRGEFHNKKKNGKLFWEMASVSPIFDEQGNIVNYLKVAEDITGEKRNEQIQNIIHNISNAVVISDNPEEFTVMVKNELGTIIDTSNFFVALYDEPKDSISLLYHKDKKDKIQTFLAGNSLTKYVIKTKKSLLATRDVKAKLVKSGEVELLGADSKIWLGVPLFTKGKVSGVIAVQSYENEKAYDKSDMRTLEIVSHQISISLERKEAEENLKIALEKAQQSDRLKTAFLHNMSHEIRTPLNGITGFIGLLQEPEIDDEDKKEYFDIINKSSNRLITTVTDIIDISKIEAGEVKVLKTEVSVNEILEEQYNFFYNEAKSKGLELNYKPSLSDREARFVTDKHKLEGILTNLIKNAIKFTEAGSISFGYTTKNLEGKEIFEFYVKDTGIGIPEDRIDAIFNRFEQADIEDTRVFEGSGLGLAISKSYVEMLGGNISVISEEGKGSTFTFSISCTKQFVKESEAKGSINKEPQTSLGNLSVIVAEDDEASIMLFKTIFKNKFHKIIYTKTGGETIEVLKKHPETDIILMDIKMPGMSGYTATREIRKFNNDVVIIAQTAFGLSGDRKKAIEAGCDDYISKPINKEILFEKIRDYLDKKSI